MGGHVFASVGRYVCEQLPGANSSPIVTKLRQSYPWPQGTRWLNFGRSRSKVKVGGRGMRSTERPSSYSSEHTCISIRQCCFDIVAGACGRGFAAIQVYRSITGVVLILSRLSSRLWRHNFSVTVIDSSVT